MLKVSMSPGALLKQFGPEKAFSMLKEAGFDGVDFGFHIFFPYGDVVNGKTDSIFSKPIDEIRAFVRPYFEEMKKNDLAAAQAHTPFPLYMRSQQANDVIMDAVKKTFVLCGDCGCPYLVVHPRFGDYAWRLDAKTQWEVNRDMYTELLPYAKEYGVKVCLENMYTVQHGRIVGSACSDMRDAAEYIDRLNDIAGEEIFSFCYDSGHQLLIGHDHREDLRILGTRVKTLHLHDNDGRDDMHVPAYMGRLDWEAMLEGLKEIGYSGWINFETAPANFPEALQPAALKLMAETGRYFASRIEDVSEKR